MSTTTKKPRKKLARSKTAVEKPVAPKAAARSSKVVGAAPRTGKSATAKKLSALGAAAKVLAETGRGMTTREMIELMAEKGYWTSPGGATPSATLYSAILKELKTKGKEARFVKTERGKFSIKA